MSKPKKAWTQADSKARPPQVPSHNPASGGVSFQRVDQGGGAVAAEAPPEPKPVAPQKSHEEDPYLTRSEVARRLGVWPSTVTRSYLDTGLLAFVWRGGQKCVRESALVAFQGRNYVPPVKGE